MTTVLDFPDLGIAPNSDIQAFFLWHNTQSFATPNNRAAQTVKLGSPIWAARIGYKTLNDDRRRLLEAFAAQLEGASGRFWLGPYDLGGWRKGTGGGTVLVDGAGQSGLTLATKGWAVGATMKVGDYLAFDSANGRRELHIVTADAVADGAGKMSLAIRPYIRNTPADGAAVDVATPRARMRLMDDEQIRMALSSPFVANTTIDVIEAVPI